LLCMLDSPRLRNQLPDTFRQPRLCPSFPDSPLLAHVTSPFPVDSPLSSSVASSLFHSRLKTHLFHKSFPQFCTIQWKCRFDFIRVKNKLCQVNFLLDNNKKTVKMAVDLTEYKTVFYIFCSTKLLSCSFSDRFTEQLIGYHTNVVSFC